ncbi:MAG: class I SAM-dependent methyltransferase [Candidatus Omnitrophica bacterium]|nr:class I SAM-dependent methyltransferase [Candidatus Omnitrophota bacterium]MCM8791034.1 class I SAM-dependent methyltransferase [Candidatus Omnitrophota bacterium]
MNYKAKTAYQEKNVARSYDRGRFLSIKGRLVDMAEKSLIYKLLSGNGIGKGARILDIPCGTGRLSLYLAKKGYKVTGADVSQAMMDEASEKIENAGYGSEINFISGNAESLNIEDGSFDAAVCLRLLGHTPPDARRRIIAELMRVSKEMAIFVYYHKNSLQNILRRRDRNLRQVMWYPVTFGQIRDEFKSLGFSIRSIRPLLLGISESLFVVAEKK